jgi:small subunit ribosomal protein S15
MALSKELKAQLLADFATKEGDTGSVEVQVAILTYEINKLNEHLQTHIHDFHSARGLKMKIGHRKALLAYLKKEDLQRYSTLIAKLGLRH